MIVTCLNCQTIFNKNKSQTRKHPNHFCSRSCSATYNNKGKQKNKPIKIICKYCCISYCRDMEHRSKIFCKNCKIKKLERSDLFKKLTYKEYVERESLKNKHPSWKHSQIRNFNRTWNKELTKLSCQVCNYKTHIELAHIIPISNWNAESTLGEINSPKNILVLCPNHHWELDNNVLSLKDIPSRKE